MGVNRTMFGSKHYVPILKWKRAEQNALCRLSEGDKRYITPLIQFVMPKPKLPGSEEQQFQEVLGQFQAKIPDLPTQVKKCWGPTALFVDFSLLYTNPLRIECLESIMVRGRAVGLHLIPVLNLSETTDFKDAVRASVKANNSGFCVRMVQGDLADLGKLNKTLAGLVSWSGLTEAKIDILVDTKQIEQGGAYPASVYASQKILNLTKWRTFIFASGAFPSDLSDCKLDEENIIPRLDWKNWLEQIRAKSSLRKPSFSDYTIQHPIYQESYQFFHPTTSIRYTLDGTWLIMKGKRQKFELYLANAKLLADDDTKFYGEAFSFGDQFIADKAKHYATYIKNPKVKGTGSTEGWLTAGINHHLALTARQIAKLP